MVRERIGVQLVPPEPHFHWRGGEITRLEGFTDAVFAFAVTLLVVSLEVPHTFSELIAAMKGFFAFALCFAILVHIWYHHYIYSRRYGLQTTYVVILNSIMLFLVLFYVYPLKFLFTMMVGGLSEVSTVPPEQLAGMIQAQQVPSLMVIYSLGYSAVFVIFALLYHHAWHKSAALELNEYEGLRTRNGMIFHAGFALVGVVVAVTAVVLPVGIAGYSGCLFFLNAVFGFVGGSILGKRERLVLARVQADSIHVP